MISHSLSRWKYQVEESERESEDNVKKIGLWHSIFCSLNHRVNIKYIQALQHLNIFCLYIFLIYVNWFHHLEFAHLPLLYINSIRSHECIEGTNKNNTNIAWALIRCSIRQGYSLAHLSNGLLFLFHLSSVLIYFGLLSVLCCLRSFRLAQSFLSPNFWDIV